MSGDVRLVTIKSKCQETSSSLQLLEDIDDYDTYKQVQVDIHQKLRRNLDFHANALPQVESLTKCETWLKYLICWLFFFCSASVILGFAHFRYKTILNIRQNGCEARLTTSEIIMDSTRSQIVSHNVSFCSTNDQDFKLFKAPPEWDYIADIAEWRDLCQDVMENEVLSLYCFSLHVAYTFCILWFFHGSLCCSSIRCLSASYIHGAKFPPLFTIVVVVLYFANLVIFFLWFNSILKLSQDLMAIFNQLNPNSVDNSFRTNLYLGVQVYLCLPFVLFCFIGFADVLFEGTVFRGLDQKLFGRDWRPLRVILASKERYDSSATFSTFRTRFDGRRMLL